MEKQTREDQILSSSGATDEKQLSQMVEEAGKELKEAQDIVKSRERKAMNSVKSTRRKPH